MQRYMHTYRLILSELWRHSSVGSIATSRLSSSLSYAYVLGSMLAQCIVTSVSRHSFTQQDQTARQDTQSSNACCAWYQAYTLLHDTLAQSMSPAQELIITTAIITTWMIIVVVIYC